MVIFDVTFVARSLRALNTGPEARPISGLSARSVGVIIFLTVLVFSLLMFLGRPLRDGFYKGFYKTSGKWDRQGERVITLRESFPPETKIKKEESMRSTDQQEHATSVSPETRRAVTPLRTDIPAGDSYTIEKTQKGLTQSGMPYVILLGFAAGICMMMGFLMQIWHMHQSHLKRDLSLSMIGLLGFGFLLWGLYGLLARITPLLIAWFLALFCVYIIFRKCQDT